MQPRGDTWSGVYHIVIRGNNKRAVFIRGCDYSYFKKLLKRYKKKYKFLLYHYVLMKNHVHLCIDAAQNVNISKVMQSLQISYNHYRKRRRGYVGHLWQGRFKSYLIDTEQYMLRADIYIEKNPVEAGLVKDPLEYSWSSYKHYAIGEIDPLVDTNPSYGNMGKTPKEQQKNYRQLMQVLIEESANNKKCNVPCCNSK
ncbi:MAG: transposase [Candidatus Omnitrophica bacterium]|nr:transposase [Candidatus Omnitrophota bacterium]